MLRTRELWTSSVSSIATVCPRFSAGIRLPYSAVVSVARVTYLGTAIGQDRVLRLALRSPTAAGRLVLTFVGVEELSFETRTYF
jgi:hypothetical protein